MADEDRINWNNVELEVSLFHAIHAHRPVGINRHFQMVFLHAKLNSAIDKKISAKEIWGHLLEMYDLVALNESDGLPFPNKEIDFALPDAISEELVDKPFPRCSLSEEAKPTETTKRRDSVKDATPAVSSTEDATNKSLPDGKSSSSSSHSAKPGTVSGDVTNDLAKSAAVDSPKVDQRKRTRHSLQTSQGDGTPVAASTPSSVKRSRRT